MRRHTPHSLFPHPVTPGRQGSVASGLTDSASNPAPPPAFYAETLFAFGTPRRRGESVGTNSNLGACGGPGCMGLAAALCGSPWVLDPGHQMMALPTTVQMGPKQRFSRSLAPQRGPCWCCMALRVDMYSPCHQMITQQRIKGPWGVVRGHPKMAIFQPTHAGPKTAKTPPVGPIERPIGGYRRLSPGPCHWVRGGCNNPSKF